MAEHFRSVLLPATFRRLVTAVLLFGVGITAVSLHVVAYPKFSPIDELQHFDYAEKISRGEVIRAGDKIGQPAMREEACRGIDAVSVLPPCGLPKYDPEHFQERGFSTAYSHTPVYYAITGVLGRSLTKLLGLGSLLTGMRLVGGLWLGSGLCLLWWAMAVLGARAPTRLIVTGLVVSTPVVLHASATLNPDGLLLPGGAGVLVAVLHVHTRWGPAIVALTCLAVVFSEPTALLVVGIAIGALLLDGVARRDLPSLRPERLRRALLGCAGACLATAVALLAAAALAGLIGGTDPGMAVPKNQQFNVADVGFDQLVGQLDALVTPVKGPYLPPMLRTTGVTVAMAVTNWLLLGAAVGGALLSARNSRLESLAAATFVGLVLGGPLFGLVNALRDTFFPIPSRYGLPAMAWLAAVLALSLRKRPFTIVVAGAAALSTGSAVWALVTA